MIQARSVQAVSKQPTTVPLFADNPSVRTQASAYTELLVDAAKVLQSWRVSLLAHELIGKDGTVKADDDLNETRLEKRELIRARLASGEVLEKPILGIGIFDNIEIGAGSDMLATLVLEGYTILPVHVRTSQLNDFEAFRAD